MRNPSPAVANAATAFAGSCAFARPPGDEPYPRALSVAHPTPVFSTADFTAGAAATIGSVGPATTVHGSGPLSGGADAGSGFAILLLDTNGRVCRGYIRADAVDGAHNPASIPGTGVDAG